MEHSHKKDLKLLQEVKCVAFIFIILSFWCVSFLILFKKYDCKKRDYMKHSHKKYLKLD